MELPAEPVDFLIIGGGSAGCALTSRLSEDPATRVLLCEAGRDVTPSNIPSVLASPYPGRTYFQQEWLWGSLQTSRGDSGTNQPTEPWFYEQARLLGGGSSINGICANRGSPHDYDEWASKGAHGWSWSDVLPYFKQLETDADYGEPLHGKSGPVPIQRHREQDWTGYTRVMAKIFADMGYAMHEDQNGPWTDGIFPTTFNVDLNGRRGSAALVYLSPEVRKRPNLTGPDRDVARPAGDQSRPRRGSAVHPRQRREPHHQGASGHRLVRCAAEPGGADAKRHRPRRASRRARHPGAGRSPGRRREPAGAPEHRHLRLPASLGAAAVARGAPSAGAIALFLQHRWHPARRHARGDRCTRRLARGGATDRHARILGEQVGTRPAACGCRRRRTSAPTSTSACCPIRAIWRG